MKDRTNTELSAGMASIVPLHCNKTTHQQNAKYCFCQELLVSCYRRRHWYFLANVGNHGSSSVRYGCNCITVAL